MELPRNSLRCEQGGRVKGILEMDKKEAEIIAEAAADAAFDFIDKLEENETLDADLLWDAVYHAGLAARTEP